MMNFGEVITRAWTIIWKHKILLLFGLFASLGAGGSSGGSNLNFSFNSSDLPAPNSGALPNWAQRVFDSMGIWLPILIAAILILVVVLIILNTLGRIGLTRGAWLADEGAEKLTFSQLFQVGKHYFWRVILLILLIWALTLALLLIVGIPALGLTILTLGIGLICLLPLLCVLGIVLWAITVLADLSIIAIVNEDLGVMEAVTRAWTVFKQHAAEFVIMALILWFGGLVAGFIIGLPMLLIFAPLLGSIILFQTSGAVQGGVVVSIILFLLYLPVLLAADAVIQSYIYTAWTLVYRRATGRMPGVTSPQVVNVQPS